MTENDLFKMFDLDPSEIEEIESGELELGKVLAKKSGPLADTVLKLDQWDLERGREHAPDQPLPMADFFGLCFLQEPEMNLQCFDGKRQQFIEELQQTAEFEAIKAKTTKNLFESGLAAKELMDRYCNLPKDADPIQVVLAAGSACQGALDCVQEAQDVAHGMGWDDSQPGNSQMDKKKLGKVFAKIKDNKGLQKIFNLAGRYRLFAQAKQRQKVNQGYDDTVGTILDGDIGRLIPSELTMLATKEFQADTMRRLVERQCMCREYRGIEPVGKGPIVVWVDHSSSMQEADNIYHAKAFGLAMAYVARQQRRYCVLGAFTSTPEGPAVVLPATGWNADALTDWLELGACGGTMMTACLETTPNRYWKEWGVPEGKTDMIIITDGIVGISESMRNNFNKWKGEKNCKLRTLIIGTNEGQFGEVSDDVHLMRSVTLNEGGIQQCLGI